MEKRARGLVRQGNIILDTEKTIHIAVGGYDFSGRLGFLVWYLDDGMGTSTIHRVFSFSPATNKIVERSPQCGDDSLVCKSISRIAA